MRSSLARWMVAMCLVSLALVSTSAEAGGTAWKYIGHYPILTWEAGPAFMPDVVPFTGYRYYKWAYSQLEDDLMWYSPVSPNDTAGPPTYGTPLLASKHWSEWNQQCSGNTAEGTYTYTSSEGYSKTRSQSYSTTLSTAVTVQGIIDAGIALNSTAGTSTTWTFNDATSMQFPYKVKWGRKGTPYARRKGIMDVYWGDLQAVVYTEGGTPPGGELRGAAPLIANPLYITVSQWMWSASDPADNWNVVLGCECGQTGQACNGSSCSNEGCTEGHHGAYAGDPAFIQPNRRLSVGRSETSDGPRRSGAVR